MSRADRRHDPASLRRLYVVHLLSVLDPECDTCRYIARIRPWAARANPAAAACERAFADDCELIATINPLLPGGSDVRDVFGHIESPTGFFYLLRLSNAEAGLLGWPCHPGSNKQ